MRFSPLFSAVGLTVVVVTRGFAAEAVKFNTNQLVGGDIPKEHRPKYSSEARRQHRTSSGIFILNISEKDWASSIDPNQENPRSQDSG